MSNDGELMLTILASYAQEESRSVSENCKWRIRKRFEKGELVNMRFMFGYRVVKGKPEPDPYTAPIVKEVFERVINGESYSKIAADEKYKGDALLQKTFTVDFLQKKIKKNEGEVPKYYVEQSHEAIIDPREFELVQQEISRRTAIGKHYSGQSILSARIICGDCGGFYGQKVWHSTSKYKRNIWQCNEKFRGKECGTPHYDEEEIKKRFLKAYNLLTSDKEELIENCRLIQKTLTDTTDIDKKIDELSRESEIVSENEHRKGTAARTAP